MNEAPAAVARGKLFVLPFETDRTDAVGTVAVRLAVAAAACIEALYTIAPLIVAICVSLPFSTPVSLLVLSYIFARTYLAHNDYHTPSLEP